MHHDNFLRGHWKGLFLVKNKTLREGSKDKERSIADIPTYVIQRYV